MRGTTIALSNDAMSVVNQRSGVRRRFNEVLMSVGAVVLLLMVLVAIDDRVREQFSLRLSSRPSRELAAAGQQVRDLSEVIFEAVRDQSLDHAPMVIFVLAAGVLVLFMLRT